MRIPDSPQLAHRNHRTPTAHDPHAVIRSWVHTQRRVSSESADGREAHTVLVRHRRVRVYTGLSSIMLLWAERRVGGFGMARGSAFYAAKRRASSSSNAATFSADTVELTLIAHSIVAVCSLLVTSVTNSLLAGCASLLLGMLYQSRPARSPSAAAQRSNAEEEDASVPRWDRRSLGGLSEGEQAEPRAERGAGSVSPDEPFTLVRAGPARTSTAGAPPLPCA